MSALRDALTRPAAYAVCRRMGHHWQPDGRCSCCRARLDTADVRPYHPNTGSLGGVPIWQGTPPALPITRRPPVRERRVTCDRGHAEWRERPNGHRSCAACQRRRR